MAQIVFQERETTRKKKENIKPDVYYSKVWANFMQLDTRRVFDGTHWYPSARTGFEFGPDSVNSNQNDVKM